MAAAWILHQLILQDDEVYRNADRSVRWFGPTRGYTAGLTACEFGGWGETTILEEQETASVSAVGLDMASMASSRR